MTDAPENDVRKGYRCMERSFGVSVFIALMGLVPVACDRREPPPAGDETSATMPPVVEMGREGLNVLFVSVDTTRADCLGCYGHPVVKTPNIDRLAAEGTRFAWCISSAPLTLVSHSTMLTGSYQFVHGARDNGLFQLDPANTTLAEIFKAAGYHTHAEVATVILNEEYGLNQGFDTYGGVPTSLPHESDEAFEDADPTDPTRPPFEPELADLHLERQAEDITKRGIELLREKAASPGPFFMFLHYYDPHQPFKAPQQFLSQYRDPYFGELTYFDEEFGKLMDAVRELGLSEKTLVVLTSDHGEGRGQHGEYTHSCFLYDATQHVPLILWGPGLVPAGKVIEDQVRLVDLAPTVLDFARLDERTEQMQGRSLVPLLADSGRGEDRSCYADTMVPRNTYGYSPLRMIRAGGWKYILGPKPELYHVSQDPLELLNLVDMEPQRAAEMRQALRDLIADSPPPAGSRASPKTMSEQEILKLEALGYASNIQQDSVTTGSELDEFEPVGENPRDHAEVIETLASTMGAFKGGEFEECIKLADHLLGLSKDNPTGLSYKGTALMRLQRYDEAIEVLRHAVKVSPDRWRDQRTLGTLLAQTGRFDQAEVALTTALELNRGDPIARINLGQLMILQGRQEEALCYLYEATVFQPDSLDAQFHHALCLANAGRTEEAIAGFREALRIKPSFVPAYRRLAEALCGSGSAQEGIAHLMYVLQRRPSQAGLYRTLADCYVELRDYGLANEFLTEAAARDPENPGLLSQLGLHLTASGRYDEAIDVLSQAVSLDPMMGAAYLRLGVALHRAGRSGEAIDELTEAIETLPDDPALRRALAQCYADTGRTEPAEVQLRKAVELAPESSELCCELGTLLARNGRAAEALELYRRAVKLRPESVEALLLLADALAEVGQPAEAVESYRRVIELAPRRAPAYLSLASLLDERGDPSQAIELLRRGASAMPDDPNIANELAWRLATSSRAELRDGAKAVELAEVANKLAGESNVSVLDTLAAAYAESGRFDEAVSTAARALELAREANDAALASRIEARRELYTRQQPYRSAG